MSTRERGHCDRTELGSQLQYNSSRGRRLARRRGHARHSLSPLVSPSHPERGGEPCDMYGMA